MLVPMVMMLTLMPPRMLPSHETRVLPVRLKPFGSTVHYWLFFSRYFGLHASMASASPWFLSRLLTPSGENRLEALFQTVVLLSQHPTLATAVEHISRIDRQEFKNLSNIGCIYRRRKAIDIGSNYWCSSNIQHSYGLLMRPSRVLYSRL